MALSSKFVCGRFVAQDILSYSSLYFVNMYVTFEYILCQDLCYICIVSRFVYRTFIISSKMCLLLYHKTSNFVEKINTCTFYSEMCNQRLISVLQFYTIRPTDRVHIKN